MALLLRDTECRACGHQHHFCLISGNLEPVREYTYVCPETGKRTRLRPTSAAEAVEFTPQGTVVLTPAVYDVPRRDAHESGERTSPEEPQPQPKRASPSLAITRTGEPQIEREGQKIGPEIHGLAARVGEPEKNVATAPPASGAAAPRAAANEPEAGLERLQEVLPEVKELAGKVGGLKQLSDIVETLKQAKKE